MLARSGACLEKGLAEPGPVLMGFVTDPNALSILLAIAG
jgi:pyruvate dehydrogenase (quinone)